MCEDSALLEELDQLEAEQVLDNRQLSKVLEQQIAVQLVKKREIDLLERELDELSLADTAS